VRDAQGRSEVSERSPTDENGDSRRSEVVAILLERTVDACSPGENRLGEFAQRPPGLGRQEGMKQPAHTRSESATRRPFASRARPCAQGAPRTRSGEVTRKRDRGGPTSVRPDRADVGTMGVRLFTAGGVPQPIGRMRPRGGRFRARRPFSLRRGRDPPCMSIASKLGRPAWRRSPRQA
jgi:hypothetical protein